MRRLSLLLIGWFLAGVWPVPRAVEPIAEGEQAARAMEFIDAYHGPRPAVAAKKLHVVYFTPADREPAARYQERLEAILEDIQSFYRDHMKRLGFGPKTFALERDGQGGLVIHLVKGKEPAAAFPGWEGRNGGNTGSPEGGEMVRREVQPVLEAAGISLERETVLIFCHLAAYDEEAGTFRHHSPYFGFWTEQSGLCFAADWGGQDLANITKKAPRLEDAEYGRMSLGKHTTIFIGGIAHELGHAFALPHCGERWDEKALGTSLMGGGNHTYREELRGEGKGSFLTMASGMRLAGRPLFNGSAKDEGEPGVLERCDLNLSTNVTRADLAGRHGCLRVEGTVEGSPAIYGAVAYFDAARSGGYRSPTATAVPDSEGRFAIEVSDLPPGEGCQLRLEFCHVNGSVSERRLSYRAASEGWVDLSQWELRRALGPVANAVARGERTMAEAALREMESTAASESIKEIARKLAGTIRGEPKPKPSVLERDVTELALGDAQAEAAEVGWLEPAGNRIPPNGEIESPFLDSGGIYATGLYAHSPSRYAFDLGGKWAALRGEGGLHTAHQPHGSVVFVIKMDGKEAYRSNVIRGTSKASYEVDLTGVEMLELIVEKAGSRNGGNWGLWLEPRLFRDAPGE